MSILIKDMQNVWLLNYVDKVSVRVGMYLGSEKVSDFALFLQGYFQAMSDMKQPLCLDEKILQGFTAWLSLRLQTKSSLNWSGLIQYKIDNSDTSMRSFFRLFKEYTNTEYYENLDGLILRYQGLVNE